jgi:hypothetical protein
MTPPPPFDDTGPMSDTQRPSIHPVVRIIIGACVAGAAGVGVLVSWFLGIITYTGCFISCSEPNRLAGVGLMALAAVLVGVLVTALAYAFVGWERERMFRVWLISTGVGAALGILSLVAS